MATVQLRLAALQQFAESGAASKRAPEFHDDDEDKKSVDNGETLGGDNLD